MKEIGAIVTDELIRQVVNDSENPLTILELAKIIKTKTGDNFIRRKIIECLRRIEGSKLFYLEEGKIIIGQCQYEKKDLRLQRFL